MHSFIPGAEGPCSGGLFGGQAARSLLQETWTPIKGSFRWCRMAIWLLCDRNYCDQQKEERPGGDPKGDSLMD